MKNKLIIRSGLLCSAFILISALSLNAQNPVKLRAGIGPAFTGTNDMKGYNLSAEALYGFTGRLQAGLGFSRFQFPKQDAPEFQVAGTINSVEANIFVFPFSKSNQGFFAGIGATLRQWDQTFWTGSNTSAVLAENYQIGPDSRGSLSFHSTGYAATIGYCGKLATRWQYHFKASMQNDIDGNIVWLLGMGAAFHLNP